jgi:hypothetical protein
LRNSSADLQVKNLPPCSYQSLHNLDCNNASKADNEIYAKNYGDDFSDYVEFASENYGDGNLADTNNNNLGNTPAERQRNQKLI